METIKAFVNEVFYGEELVRSSISDFYYIPHFVVFFYFLEFFFFYVVFEAIARIIVKLFHDEDLFEKFPERILAFKRRSVPFFQHTFLCLYTWGFFRKCKWWYPNQAVVLPPDIYAKREYNMSVRFIIVEQVAYYVYKQCNVLIFLIQGKQSADWMVMSIHHFATLFLIGFAYITVKSGVPVILLVIGGNPSESVYDIGRMTRDLNLDLATTIAVFPMLITWFYYRIWRYIILEYGFCLRVKERWIQLRSWRYDECLLPVLFFLLLVLQIYWWVNLVSFILKKILTNSGVKKHPTVCSDELSEDKKVKGKKEV